MTGEELIRQCKISLLFGNSNYALDKMNILNRCNIRKDSYPYIREWIDTNDKLYMEQCTKTRNVWLLDLIWQDIQRYYDLDELGIQVFVRYYLESVIGLSNINKIYDLQ